MPDQIDQNSQNLDRNEGAFYAQQYLDAGNRLDLGPSIEKQGDGSYGLAKLESPEDTAKFYEENDHLGLDLSAPDAEQNWNNIETALRNRHTDYLSMFGQAAGEIAKLPVNLIEGIAEEGLSLKGIRNVGYSTVEGAARGLRDMWGIAAQSENPDSWLFNFRSLINSVMHGKVSGNWQDRAQQWNEARKFLHHSRLMSEGDETLLEQFKSLNLSNDTKEQLRSMVNPKIAHTMAFLGLELPSLIAAPFTGGASTELAISAGASQLAKQAANASVIRTIGARMANVQQRFESMAGRLSETVAGNVAYGLGKAIQPVANLAESAFGGTIESITQRSAFVAKEVENAAVVTAMNASEAVMGANATRQTVGFIGSIGLRTSSELLTELGDHILQRAGGVIPVGEINGLTVLERLASAKHLSPSAKFVAKAANVIVDPFLQMSTAGLKNAYKDAMIFGTLGYFNDKERGAVGGAATGMVWGGYSGGFRHAWANISGRFDHSQIIDNFDRNFLNAVESKGGQEFSNAVRPILSQVDALKSSKISANTRVTFQNAWLSIPDGEKSLFIANFDTVEALKKKLLSKSIGFNEKAIDRLDGHKAAFTILADAEGKLRPILHINPELYRPADIGHEVMSHMMAHSLLVKGKLGEFMRQMIGEEENGGIYQNDEMLLGGAVRRRLSEIAVDEFEMLKEQHSKSGSGEPLTQFINKRLMATDYENTKASFKSALDEIRLEAKRDPMFWVNQGWRRLGDPSLVAKVQGYLFEENLAKHAESLFMHTNLSEITMNPATRPLRLMLERARNEIFSKQVTEMELAGIRAKHGDVFDSNGTPIVQVEVYDGGKYHRHEGAEGLLKSMVREAINGDGNPISKLPPERQAIEAKRYGKEYLFKFAKGGATMLGSKEQNEIFTKNAVKGLSVLEQLPQEFRPEFISDEHGNKSVDMYLMKNEAYDALIAAGVIDKHSAEMAMGMRDMMKQWESSGFTSSNIMSAFYWGDSHRIQRNGLYERLFGKDVPVTHRVFVPFELKMTVKMTDANGKPLRVPKGGMTATVIDYMAIHRRKIRLWQRPDISSLFRDDVHYASTFDHYLTNMMADPATRVPSAELFRKEFGSKAEAVRDAMYETFGGRKRIDESYINAPREGYKSNPENPDYPIHSMKLELIVGGDKMMARPMPYHHGRSYEGLRRNYSTGGFEIYGNDGRRLRNGQGYEIMAVNNRFKAFDPFGVLIGAYDTAKKAMKAALKNTKKLDEADIMPNPIEIENAKVSNGGEINVFTPSVYSDKKGMNYSGGIRLSGGGVAKDTGEFITYKEDFVPDLLKKVRDVSSGLQHTSTNARPYLPNIVLTYADVLSDNGAEVDKFLKRVGAPMSTSDIAIIPSTSSGLGVFHRQETLGEFAVSTLNTETGKHTIVVDVDAIDAKHSGQRAANKIRSALEAKFSEIIQQYSEDSVIWGAPVSIPTQVIGDGTRHNYKAYAYSYGRLFKLPKAVLEQEIRDSVDSFKARLDEAMAPYASHFSIDSNGMASPIKGGLFEPTAQNLRDPNFLRKFFATASKNPRFQGLDLESNAGTISFRKNESPIVVEKVNKAAFDIIASAYAYNNALMQYGEFIHFPDDNGGVGAAIVVRGENAKKFQPIVSNFDSIVANLLSNWDTNSVKESKYFDSLLDLANFVSHTLIQRNSNEAVIEHSRTRGGISMEQDKASSVRAVQYIVNPSTVFENLDFSTQDIARIDSIKSDNNMQFTLGSGVGFTVAMTRNPDGTWGKNYLTGFRGGPSDVGFNKDGTFKNKTRPLFEGGPRVGSLDMVTLQEALGNLPSDAFMDSGGPINYLMLMAMHEIPEAANDITKAYEDYVKNQGVSDKAVQVSFIDRIDEIAANYDKGLVMETADDIRGATMSWRDGGYHNLKFPQRSPYVNGWAKSKVLMSLSKHYGVNSIGEPIGSKAFTSTRAYKVMRANGEDGAVSQALLKSLNEKVVKLSKKADITMVRQSVGSLDVIEESRHDELRAKGLVSTINFNGKSLDVFEFSDAGASLNLARAANRPHILPFLSHPDPEAAFSDYAAAVRRRMTQGKDKHFINENIILGEAKLGDIFNHSELYKYYPEFRDMRVYFKDFHGGRHVFQGGISRIELGVRSLAAAELNLPAEMMGTVFNSGEALSSAWIKRNPIASIILHEVQHAIQRKHGWNGDNVTISKIPQNVAAHAFANLLGVKTSLAMRDDLSAAIKDPDVLMKDGKFVDLSEANMAATSEAELLDRLILTSASPVLRSFRANAKPLIHTATRNFAEFILAEHRNGMVSDVIAKQAMALHEDAKNAMSVDDAINVYMQFEEMRNQALSTMPEYSLKMHNDVQFRLARQAMGLVSAFDILDNAKPSEAATMLKLAMAHYSDLAYMMEPVERMARETEGRAGMSEMELAQTGRGLTDDKATDPIVRMVRNALDMSKLGSEQDFAKSISKNGIANVILKSVGGLGDTDPTDSRILTLMGKAVLMHAISHAAYDTLDILKRTVLETRGWEVDKQGRMRLTSGTHIISGLSPVEMGQNLKSVLGVDNVDTSEGVAIRPSGFVPEGHTYSIEDIATLAGATVESSTVFTVGNSAIDAVLSPMFPPYFKGADIMGLMDKSGIATPEGMAMARVQKIAQAMGEVTLTKNDLINLLAINHSKFHLSTQIASSTIGDINTRSSVSKGVFDNLSPEKRSLLIQNNALAHHYFQDVNNIQNAFENRTASFAVGAYKLSGRKIEFMPRIAPEWVQQLGSEAVSKWDDMTVRVAKHVASTNRTAYVGSPNGLTQRVRDMNRLYASKAMLIGPMIDAAIKKITEDKGDNISQSQKIEMAVSLMSEIERANVVISSHEFASESQKDFSLPRMGQGISGSEYGLSEEGIGRLFARTHSTTEQVALGYNFSTQWGGNATSFSVLPQHSSIYPSSVSLSDAVGHATSSLTLASNPVRSFNGNYIARGESTTDLGQFESGALARISNTLAVPDETERLTEQIINGINRHQSEYRGMIEVKIDSLERLLADRGDAFLREEHKGLSNDEAATLLEKHRNDMLSITRDQYIANRILEGDIFHERYGAHASTSGENRNVYAPKEAYPNAFGTHFVGVSNVQGKAFGDTLVVDIESISPSTDHPSEFANSGLTLQLVPPEIRRGYVRGKTYLDVAAQVSLFGRHGTSISERQGPTKTLKPLGNLAVSLASENSFGGLSTMTNVSEVGLSHIIGGNAILAVGNLIYAGLREDPQSSTSAYVSRNAAGIQALYADANSPFSLASATRNRGMAVANAGGQVAISNRSIGLAASLPMSLLLKVGYMDFWGSDRELSLDIPEAFKSPEYAFLSSIEGSREFAARVLTPDAERELDSFISKLDEHSVTLLVNELSTLQNSRTIGDLLGYMNVHELIAKDEQTPIPKMGTKPISESIDYALSSNVHHTVKIHAAIKHDGLGYSPQMLKAHQDMLRAAIRTKDFWIGYFAQGEAVNEMPIYFPRPSGSDGLFYSRQSQDGARVPTYYQSVEGTHIKRTDIKAGHDVENLAFSEREPQGLHTMGTATSRIGYDDSKIQLTFDERGYNFSTTQALVSSTFDNSGSDGRAIFRIPQGFEGSQAGGLPKEHFMSMAKGFYLLSESDHEQYFGSRPASGRKYIALGDNPDGTFAKIDKSVGVDTAKIIAQDRSKVLSSGTRRTLAVNQIVAMAKQMGTDRVAIQPARFTASSRIHPAIIGATTRQKVIDMTRDASLVRMAFRSGTSFGDKQSVDSRPNIGLSWNRLEDGRILVNFSPDTNIPAMVDRSYQSVSERQNIGLNLLRSIGYNAESNGIIMPQDPKMFGNLLSRVNNHIRQNQRQTSSAVFRHIARTLKSGFPILSESGNADIALMRHYDKSIAASLKGGVVGPSHAASMLQGMTQNGIENMNPMIKTALSRIVSGNDPIMGAVERGSDSTGFTKHLEGIGMLANGFAPDMSYVSFILPKDATIEHLQRQVLGYYMGSSQAVLATGMDMFHGYHESFSSNPFGNSHNPWGMRAYFTDYMLEPNHPQNAEGRSLSIRDFSSSEGTSNLSSGERNTANAYASTLKEVHQANPLFISGLENAFAMMSSTDRGYHIPLAEQTLRKSGDRVEAIRAMFPNRPELEQFSWDNPVGMNLSIVSPSRGAAKVWRVGYDKVVGYDATGNPVKERVVQSARSEAEAQTFADGIAKSGILAEHVRMLNLETEAKIENMPSSPNVTAEVYQPIAFNTDSMGQTPVPVLKVQDGKYAVGNFSKTFASEAEAKAFASMVLKPEVVSGKVPSPIDIRLSSGDLKAMERDLRERIGFSTNGSPIEFASTAMNAIVNGGDKNRRVRDKATGLEWYDMLTFNGTGKQEMRVTGLAQFLYDHKSVTLSRQEVAEYIYTMYPTMGRRRVTERNTLGGVVKIPSTDNPIGAEVATTWSYHLMHQDQSARLTAMAAHADETGQIQLAAFADTLKEMHLNAFKSVLSSYMPVEKVNELFPSYSHMAQALRGHTPELKGLSGPMFELYREAYNDSFKAMSQEQLNVASGFDGLLPDPRSHYDQKRLRPLYLRPIEAENMRSNTTSIRGQEVFSTVANTNDYGHTFTTSASVPYQVDVLYGHVQVDTKLFSDYIANLEKLSNESADPTEKSRYQSMIASAQRTYEVRKSASNKARQSGHWQTPASTMQYGHLRYASGMSLAESLPNPEPTELVDSVNNSTYKGDTGAAQPVTVIEELQSDPYQRSTFGTSSDTRLILASDLKQAEALHKLPELDALNKQLAAFDVTSEQKIKGTRFLFDWSRTNNSKLIHDQILAKEFFERLSLIEKHMILENIGGVSPEKGKLIRTIPNDMASKYGVSTDLHEILLSPEMEKQVYEWVGQNLLNQTQSNEHGVELYRELCEKLFPEFNGVVPNLNGSITYKDLLNSNARTPNGFAGTIYAMMTFMAMTDERFHANAESIVKKVRNEIPSNMDFDSIAYDFIQKINSRLNSNQHGLSPRNTMYARMVVNGMNKLLEPNSINLEHMYTTGTDGRWTTADRDNSKFWDVKHVFYAHDEISNGYGSDVVFRRKNPKYVSMTPLEAFRKDLDLRVAMQIKKHGSVPKAYHDAFVKQLSEFDAQGEMDIGSLMGALVYDKGALTDSVIKQIVSNITYDLVGFSTVDGDMDPSSHSLRNSRYRAFPHEAKTPLGRMLEISSFYPIESVYQFSGDAEINVLRAKRDALAASMKLPSGNEQFSFPDTIPLGEDNAYRELAVKYYVMRSLQAGHRGLTIADARHHRVRYSSLEHYASAFTLGKGLTFPASKTDLGIPYMLSRATASQSHANFVGRMLSEGIQSMHVGDGILEHNGLRGDFTKHLEVVLSEGLSDMPDIGERDPAKLAHTISGVEIQYGNGSKSLSSLVKSIAEGTATAMSPEAIEQNMKISYGSDSGRDIFKRLVKTFDSPTHMGHSIPIDKTHGYAVNYGAPHWNNKVYYAGLPEDFIAQQSHDLFQRPIVEMKDGKYNILDAKTGRLLIGGIENPAEMQERVAQLSKYLGRVPIVSIFLKQFAKVGGYAMEGHLYEGKGASAVHANLPESVNTEIEKRYPDYDASTYRLKMNRATSGTPVGPESPLGMNTIISEEADPTAGKIVSFNQGRTTAENFQPSPNYKLSTMACMLDSMGIRNTSDHQQMSAAMSRMLGFNGPMLIIKPKFQTEAFRQEMLKMVKSGLPLMSVGDLHNPAERINEGIKAFKFYANPYPIQNPQRDEAR